MWFVLLWLSTISTWYIYIHPTKLLHWHCGYCNKVIWSTEAINSIYFVIKRVGLPTRLEKKLLHFHLRQQNRYFCVSSGLKLTWNVALTAPLWNPTLPWPDFYSNVKRDCRSPKPQLSWSFLQNPPSHCGKSESTIYFIFFLNSHWLF